MGVVVEKAESDLVQRRLHGRDLRQHLDAVPVFVDHSLDTAHLTLNAPEPSEELVFGCRVPTSRGGSEFHAPQASRYPLGVFARVSNMPMEQL